MNIWPKKKKTSMLVYVPAVLVSIGALGAGAALLRASFQKRTEKRKQEEKDIGRWENEGGNPSGTARPNNSVKSKDFTSVQG